MLKVLAIEFTWEKIRQGYGICFNEYKRLGVIELI